MLSYHYSSASTKKKNPKSKDFGFFISPDGHRTNKRFCKKRFAPTDLHLRGPGRTDKTMHHEKKKLKSLGSGTRHVFRSRFVQLADKPGFNGMTTIIRLRRVTVWSDGRNIPGCISLPWAKQFQRLGRLTPIRRRLFHDTVVQGTQMKTIKTKRGIRTVQSFPATSMFWGWWRANSHPEWVSVSKDDCGKWWVTVWGTDAAVIGGKPQMATPARLAAKTKPGKLVAAIRGMIDMDGKHAR